MQNSLAQVSVVAPTISGAERCVSPPPRQNCWSTAQRPNCGSEGAGKPGGPATPAITNAADFTIHSLDANREGAPHRLTFSNITIDDHALATDRYSFREERTTLV